jgi:hypothetical protein
MDRRHRLKAGSPGPRARPPSRSGLICWRRRISRPGREVNMKVFTNPARPLIGPSDTEIQFSNRTRQPRRHFHSLSFSYIVAALPKATHGNGLYSRLRSDRDTRSRGRLRPNLTLASVATGYGDTALEWIKHHARIRRRVARVGRLRRRFADNKRQHHHYCEKSRNVPPR